MNNKKKYLYVPNAVRNSMIVNICGVLLTLWCAGCLNSHLGSGTLASIQIRYCGDNWFECGGDKVALNHLTGWLENEGAGEFTAIQIAVPPSVPTVTFTAITQELMHRGFKKIMFIRPRHINANVGNNNEMDKDSPKAPLPVVR